MHSRENEKNKSDSMYNTNSERKIKGRICFIALFTLLALAIVECILFLYDGHVEEIHIGNDFLAFAPVYNRSGSWLHGRLNLGYRPDILFAEHMITLFILWFLSRFTDFISMILGMSRRWSLFVDLTTAATLARLINVIRGKYTLDYVYIGCLHATYDLVDIYLGIGLLFLCIWVTLAEIRTFRLKKQVTRGMSFWGRMRWELVLTGNACRAPFIRTAKWKEIQDRYEYHLRENEQSLENSL